jgi:hypothetical protein
MVTTLIPYKKKSIAFENTYSRDTNTGGPNKNPSYGKLNEINPQISTKSWTKIVKIWSNSCPRKSRVKVDLAATLFRSISNLQEINLRDGFHKSWVHGAKPRALLNPKLNQKIKCAWC